MSILLYSCNRLNSWGFKDISFAPFGIGFNLTIIGFSRSFVFQIVFPQTAIPKEMACGFEFVGSIIMFIQVGLSFVPKR